MKVFVILGYIEFLRDDEHTALVRSVENATFMDEDKVEDYAVKEGLDYLMPHYYNGRITFMQYHKEQS